MADEVVVLDHGRVAAAGTPGELKARIGGERIAVTVAATSRARARPRRPRAPSPRRRRRWTPSGARSSPRSHPGTALIDVLRALDAAGIDAADIGRREATLDDVFLTLTGARRQEALSPP